MFIYICVYLAFGIICWLHLLCVYLAFGIICWLHLRLTDPTDPMPYPWPIGLLKLLVDIVIWPIRTLK